MTKVHIIDKTSGKTVSVILASVGGMNYEATRKEWEDTAWKAAVDDGDVDVVRRNDYEFKFIEE